jgi:predicted Zn-dependent protease|tara:strand:- start:30433 stop:31938 length:1506 start_codon:yes stop_codon:yes gene_type:complete
MMYFRSQLLELFTAIGILNQLPKKILISLLISNLTLANFSFAQTSQIQLPSLGETSSSVISMDLELQIGEAWLRSFYRQTPLNRDYLLQDYIEKLVQQLKPYSQINYSDLRIVVVDNPTMNAFAVPGGVIGIHSGLLLHAGTEDELASVIAHEMAHLSQRHFARSVAAQQAMGMASMAGLLAAVVLAATAGGDAGLAMMSVAQGAAIESQLRYSRQNETEADRIGQSTLVTAGRDPKGAVRMFEKMLAATRYAGDLAPEYLLTHPLPQSRVIDTETRANQYASRIYSENPSYQLMAARVKVADNETPEIALRNSGNAYRLTPNSNLAKYGYTLALKDTRHYSEAMELATELLEGNQTNLVFQSLYAELLLLSDQADLALKYLLSLLTPGTQNHVITMQLADTYKAQNLFEQTADILQAHSQERPKDPIVWYELAEAYGLSGNIYELHLARSKYFELVGSFQQAIEHVRLAKRQLGDNKIEQAVLDQRIRQISQTQSREMDL